jgi:hypothetical protein
MIFHCPHCHVKAKAGASDCANCGRRMTRPCPSCSETVSATAPACKYCGEELAALRVAAPRPDVVFLDEPAAPAVPWEDTKRGVVGRWWATWAAASFSPSAFFRGMAKGGGHQWPVGFAFGLIAQGIVLAGLALLAVGGVTAAAGSETAVRIHWKNVALLYVAAIPVLFVAGTAALYGMSFLWHVLLKLLGAKGGFGTTLRIVGYSSAADGWLLIPWLGLLLAPLFRTAMHYHGFRQAHGLGRFRAAFAALLPMLLIGGLVACGLASGAFCCPGARAFHGTC